MGFGVVGREAKTKCQRKHSKRGKPKGLASFL